MSHYQSRQVHLVRRPDGMPVAEDFKIVDVALNAPAYEQVFVQNLFMSVDPYMRGRMNAHGVYAEPYALNEVMYGGALGEVLESRCAAFKPGDIVLNQCGWRDRFVTDADALTPVNPFDHSRLSLYLGALGMPGMTAYVGLNKFGEPKPGETVFVSAASGAVGAIVCQLAKLQGCRVVGSVGNDDKARWLREECGVDAVINYHAVDDLTAALGEAAPDGVDVYFENVGGEHLRAALNCMNHHGRIAACGMISTYNRPGEPGPDNLMLTVGKRIRLQGFIVFDHADMREQFLKDMEQWIGEGKVICRETIVDGLDNAASAFLGLFDGANFGKMIVRL